MVSLAKSQQSGCVARPPDEVCHAALLTCAVTGSSINVLVFGKQQKVHFDRRLLAVSISGTFSLCAMQVPADNFDHIADIVNQFQEVAHNYERDHRLNMWFVLAAESKAELAEIIRRIEQATDLTVFNFPKQREFYVNFRLSI